MHEVAELLKGIGQCLWPIVTLVCALTFKSQIRDLAGRLRRGKVLGQEFELQDKLHELEASAQVVATEVAALPPTSAKLLAPPEENDPTETIAKEAVRSPRVALVLLGAEIEKQLRHVLASMGLM